MKPTFAFLLLFVSVLALAQPDSVSLPMKGRVVFYETTVPTHPGHVKGLTDLSGKWVSKSFSGIKEPRPIEKLSEGKVEGTGIVKIPINEAGDYYWLKFSISIRVTDSICVFQAYDFYEKPTFKGVTNDYSKIEYRWRDFKKGKPWSPGDARLFAGLDGSVNELIKSYVDTVTRGEGGQ